MDSMTIKTTDHGFLPVERGSGSRSISAEIIRNFALLHHTTFRYEVCSSAFLCHFAKPDAFADNAKLSWSRLFFAKHPSRNRFKRLTILILTKVFLNGVRWIPPQTRSGGPETNVSKERVMA